MKRNKPLDKYKSKQNRQAGAWLRDTREGFLISQQHLANKLPESPSTISRIENGHKKPDREFIVRWANANVELRPDNQINLNEFINEALKNTNLARADNQVNNFLGGTFGEEIQKVLEISRDKKLNFEEVIKEEFRRFGSIWLDCFSIFKDLLEKKNYTQTAEAAEKLALNGKGIKFNILEPRALAYLLDLAGNARYHLGQFEKANYYLDSAKKLGKPIAEALGAEYKENAPLVVSWKRWLSSLYDHRSDVKRVIGDNVIAIKSAKQSFLLADETNDIVSIARAIRKMGLADLVRGAKADEAIDSCNHALKLLQETKGEHSIRNLYEQSKILTALGWASNIKGEYPQAIKYHKDALLMWKKVGKEDQRAAHQYEIMKVHRYLAEDYFQSDPIEKDGKVGWHLKEAQRIAVDEYDLDEKENFDAEWGMINLGFGKLYLESHQTKSEDFLWTALTIFDNKNERYTDEIRKGIVHRNLAKLYAFHNIKSDEIIACGERAITLFKRRECPNYAVGTMIELAEYSKKIKNAKVFNKYKSNAKKLLDKPTTPLDEKIVFEKYSSRFGRL